MYTLKVIHDPIRLSWIYHVTQDIDRGAAGGAREHTLQVSRPYPDAVMALLHGTHALMTIFKLDHD